MGEINLMTEKTGGNIILKEDQSAATKDIEQITKEDVANYSEEEKSKSPRIEQSKDVNEIVMTTKEPIPMESVVNVGHTEVELSGNEEDKESLVCSDVEITESKVITEGDQIAELNKKE